MPNNLPVPAPEVYNPSFAELYQILNQCTSRAFGDFSQLVVKNGAALPYCQESLRHARSALGINQIFLENADANVYQTELAPGREASEFSHRQFQVAVYGLEQLGLPSKVASELGFLHLIVGRFVGDASKLLDGNANNPVKQLQNLLYASYAVKKMIVELIHDVDRMANHRLIENKPLREFVSTLPANLDYETIATIKDNELFLPRDDKYYEGVFGKRGLKLLK